MKDKYEAFILGFSIGAILFCTLWAYVIGNVC